jgi:hypothetical protein
MGSLLLRALQLQLALYGRRRDNRAGEEKSGISAGSGRPGDIARAESHSASYKDELTRILPSLHSSPGGHQVLTLFSLDRLIPLTPAHISTAREIFNQFKKPIPQSAKVAENR